MAASARTTNDKEIDYSAYLWMIRPCHVYDEEYKECSSVFGRMHQNYVSGSFTDCSKYMHDFRNCKKLMNQPYSEINESTRSIINNELERIAVRKQNALNNDVWEYRTSPPADWNKPLDNKNILNL